LIELCGREQLGDAQCMTRCVLRHGRVCVAVRCGAVRLQYAEGREGGGGERGERETGGGETGETEW
jgi:hypothetical protein